MNCGLAIWKLTRCLLHLLCAGTALTCDKWCFACCKPSKMAQYELLGPPRSFSLSWSGLLLTSQATGEVMEATLMLEKSLWLRKQDTPQVSTSSSSLAWGPLRRSGLSRLRPAEVRGAFQQGMGPVSSSCTWILITASKYFSFHLSSQEERSAFSARVGQCFQRGRKGKTSPVSAALGLINAYNKISSEAAIYFGGGRIRVSFSCQTTHPHNYVFTPYFDNGSLQTN